MKNLREFSTDMVLRYDFSMTDTHRVRELAQAGVDCAGGKIERMHNSHKVAAENELNVFNKASIKLGLYPIALNTGLMEEGADIAQKYVNRCDTGKICCT